LVVSIESLRLLQGVEVKARVRIYGPTSSYIPIPSFVRYLGFDEKVGHGDEGWVNPYVRGHV